MNLRCYKITFFKRVLSTVLFSVLLVCLFPVSSYAYDESTDSMNQPRLSLNDFKNGYRLKGTSMFTLIPHQNFGTTTISHMNEALYEWNRYLPTEVKGVNRNPTLRHTATNYPNLDGVNRIYRKDIGSTEYVAETSWWVSGGYRSEADMNINMYYDWANSAMSGRYDLWTVFLHEAGHIFGFADIKDTNYTDRVMYQYVYENKTRRKITSAEQYILQNIYS